jgi:glycosyl hydrolase family 62
MVVTAAMADQPTENTWQVSTPILSPGPKGAFDEVAVKDPSLVFFDSRWHLFYTARSRTEYTTGYVAAKELTALRAAPRHELKMIRGKTRYGAAPQIFYYEPQRRWYLIFQNRDANYQPAFSTTTTIAEPDSWSEPAPLLRKDTEAKWIDFWVIGDETKAYLFYTQAHQGVIVRSTSLEDFPGRWSAGKMVFDNVHEAVHIYKVKDRQEFHMIYELNEGGIRSFGLATAENLTGPWQRITDRYAAGHQLQTAKGVDTWTHMVSHGEVLRTGYDQRMEYNPTNCRWLIQGIRKEQLKGPYPVLPWKLGIITKLEADPGPANRRP